MTIRPTDTANASAPVTPAQPVKQATQVPAPAHSTDAVATSSGPASPAALGAALSAATTLPATVGILQVAAQNISLGYKDVARQSLEKATQLARGPADFGPLLKAVATYNAYCLEAGPRPPESSAAMARLIEIAPDKLDTARLAAWYDSNGAKDLAARASKAAEDKPWGSAGRGSVYALVKVIGSKGFGLETDLFRAYIQQ